LCEGGNRALREAEEGVNVGYYSPLPPARTGVADYSAALLAALRNHGEVVANPERAGIALYHLGNNSLHAAIYRRAIEQPGVVVLHDAVLHHFLLGSLSERDYVEEFVYNYGEWSRGLAEDLWKSRASSGSDSRYFDYPMLRRVAEGARAVVVHNPGAARMVRAHAPDARVIEIPHLFATPSLPSPGEVQRYRVRLGIAPGTFVFGVFGYLRESKRLVTVLEAFQRISGAGLLVAGQFVSSDLERAVEPLLRRPGVVRRPFLEESEFWQAASAVDACINLRYPAAGETSGIAIRLMGIGKPALLTDGEECSRFPVDACVRVAPGIGERESLWENLVLLTSMSEVACAIGQRGAEHIQARHRVEDCARAYWNLLSEFAS
jgi:glycosyltransferase involved in cell wall biosynthesis